MRYILDDRGYVQYCGDTNMSCDERNCTLYTGTIPDGYSSIEEWARTANIRAYKMVDGNLVYDYEEDVRLQDEYSNCYLVVNDIKCKNLFNKYTIVNGWLRYYDNGLMDTSQNHYVTSGYITVKPNTTYTLNLYDSTGLGLGGIMFYDSFKNWIPQGIAETQTVITFTTPLNTKYVRFVLINGVKDNVQLEEGYNATEYTPHKEFSNQVCYSNAEQVIGTWNAGETLYRKVINGITSSERLNSFFLGNKIVVKNFYGLIYFPSGNDLIPLNYANPGATVFSYIHGIDECYLNIEILNGAFYNCEFFAVVEYIEKSW
jgi:hypothetical protein